MIQFLKKAFGYATKIVGSVVLFLIGVGVILWAFSGSNDSDETTRTDTASEEIQSSYGASTNQNSTPSEESKTNLVFEILTKKEWPTGPKIAGLWTGTTIGCDELPSEYTPAVVRFHEVALSVANEHGHPAPNKDACQINMRRHPVRGWHIALQFFPSKSDLDQVNVLLFDKNTMNITGYKTSVLNFQISKNGGIDLISYYPEGGEDNWFRRTCFLPNDELTRIQWEGNCETTEWDMNNPPDAPLDAASVVIGNLVDKTGDTGEVASSSSNPSTDSSDDKDVRRREWITRCSRYEAALKSCSTAASIRDCVGIQLGQPPVMEEVYCDRSGQPLFNLMGL